MNNTMDHTQEQVKAVSEEETHVATRAMTPFYRSTVDSPIEKFLEHSRLLVSGTIEGYNTIVQIKPVYEFFKLQSVLERTKFFALINGIMEVELRITCPVYATGLARMSVTFGDAVGDLTNKAIALTTQDGVTVNLADRRPAKITFPIAILFPYINLTELIDDDKQKRFVNINIGQITKFRDTSTGGVPEVNYQLFARMIQSNINTATATGETIVYSSAREDVGGEAKGIFSYPASIVEMASKALKDVPVIGKFAYATSIAASAVKRIAILFGYSRPNTLETIDYMQDISAGIGPIDVKGYTLDKLAELPLTFDLLAVDSDALTFRDTIGRYGQLRLFEWETVTTVNTFVGAFNIVPSMNAADLGLFLPPVGYFSMMYRFWRGSMKYRVSLAANSFIRGRLRAIWLPGNMISQAYYTTHKTDILANAFNVMIDITTSTTVEMVIPWGQKQPYLPVLHPDEENFYNNGSLIFVVEEQLRAPSGTWRCDILVEVAAGEDYELMIPTVSIIEGLSTYPTDSEITSDSLFTPVNTVIDFGTNRKLPTFNNAYAEMTPAGDMETFIPSSQQMNMPVTKVIPEEDIIIEGPAAYFMGERFLTHRVMLKRFFQSGSKRGTNAIRYRTFAPAYPLDTKVIVAGAARVPSGFMMTPIAWMGKCFLGYRGCVRTNLMFEEHSPSALSVSRVTTFRTVDSPFATYETGNTITTFMSQSDAGSGFTKHYANLGDNITIDFPFQSMYNFYPTYNDPSLDIVKQYLGIGVDDGQYEVRHAIGEDFNFVLWRGVPGFYASRMYNPP